MQVGPKAEHLLLGATGLLCLLGIVMVYSASSVASVQASNANWSTGVRQLVWMVLGLGLGLVASRIPLMFWRDRIAPMMILVALGLQAILALDIVLGAVGGPRIPFALTKNGATRWLGTDAFQVQPSDFAKLALILWLARLLDKRSREIGSGELLKPIFAVTGALSLMVLLGDDLGTTLLLGVIVIVMLFLAGAPLRQVGAIAGAAAAVATLVILVFGGFRVQRIAAYFNPSVTRPLVAINCCSHKSGLPRVGSLAAGQETPGLNGGTCQRRTRTLFLPLSVRNWASWAAC